MKFNGLTNKGREYLAKVQANQSAITFKKIVIGDGRLDEHDNPAELTRLINKKAEKGIISKEQNADIVTLLTYVDNVSLSQGYYPREIGVYIDDGGEEKLYYYMNDGDETSWIPPESYGPFKIELKLNIIASNAESIIVNNPAKSMYVTKEYVDKELAKKENTIEKRTGFNLDKTDDYTENNSNKLMSAAGVKGLYDWVRNKFGSLTLNWTNITGKPNLTSTEDLDRLLSHKEDTFVKNTGFNKNFGTTSGTVMEGDKYEVIKSIPGTTSNIKFIQDSVVKNKGDFCIDKHTGRICKCIQQTSTTTNDSNYFQDVTLDKLSDRLDNLEEISLEFSSGTVTENELVEAINTAFTKSKKVIVYFLNNNRERILSLDISKFKARKGSQLQFVLWQVVTLEFTNVEYNSDDSNTIRLDPRFGHNVIFKNSWVNQATWNFISGVGYRVLN